MNKPPAFQFYHADFMQGTLLFTAEETGAYIRLLCWQWDNGRVPKEPRDIATITGVKYAKLSRVILKFLTDSDGNLFNERLEKERIKQSQYREKQAQNGAKRWKGDEPSTSDGNAKPQVSLKSGTSQTHALQSSSSSSSSKEEKTPPKPPAERSACQLRLGALFGRRATTEWSEKETKSYRKTKPERPDFEDEVKLIEWFYLIEEKAGYPLWRRKDLETLLNNWTGELDKARAQRGFKRDIGGDIESIPTLEQIEKARKNQELT